MAPGAVKGAPVRPPNGALEITPDCQVATITEIYANASTFPCKVITQAGNPWVMKLRGSGPGPMALLTEFLALRAARAMALIVPDVRPIYLPPDFPWTIGTDEFDGIIQRSYGWNLGVGFVDQAQPATPEAIFSGDPAFLQALFDVDRALSNMDRTTRNPNVLATDAGLIAIDFDACLFLRRAAQGIVPSSFPLPAGHLCSDRHVPAPMRKLDPQIMIDALREAPAEWLAGLQLDIDALEAKLLKYIATWNAQ
jgi:hypothetical protein